MREEDRKTLMDCITNQCRQEPLKYCRTGVDTHKRCCLKFRELYLNRNHQEMWIRKNCITVPSPWNLVLQTTVMDHEAIGIIRASGKKRATALVLKSIKKWIMQVGS